MVTLTLASGSTTSGGSISLNLSIASTGGSQCADVQWVFSPPAGVSLASVTIGAAATAASKTLSQSGNLCVIASIGTNQNIIGNGVLVTAVFNVAAQAFGSFSVGVASIVASDANANALTTSGVPGIITVPPTPPPPPVITSTSPVPPGFVGTVYSYQFTATGVSSITWSATGLPSWASLSLSGLMTGTPDANAVTVFNVTATNIGGSSGPTPFSITITGGAPPPPVAPVITTTSPLPAGVSGIPYSFQFAATGTGPITWSATGLQSWASLSSTGLLSGTSGPTTTAFNVTATNAGGHDGPKAFSLTVNPLPQTQSPKGALVGAHLAFLASIQSQRSYSATVGAASRHSATVRAS